MAGVNHIVVFDGVCNLCNGLVRFIITRDKRKKFSFTPLQSTAGRDILLSGGIDPGDINTVVYLSDGRYYFRSAAILRIFRDLGRGWQFLWSLVIIPRFIRDFFYFMIARRRYRVFGKRDTCMIPTEDVKDRFL